MSSIAEQQATSKKALNLQKMNLISVFSSPKGRRALVRMKNGKFVRVRIGDGLDGGQVYAIDDHSLYYRKRNKNYVIMLPSNN